MRAKLGPKIIFALCLALGFLSVGPARADLFIATPLQSDKRHVVDPRIYTSPAAGIYAQLTWREIQPEADRYDWTTLDRVLDQALPNKKVLSLSVASGAWAPQWLAGAGARYVDMPLGRGGVNRVCNQARLYLPWDETYQTAYGRMIRALAHHLDERGAKASVRIVKVTLIGQWSSELRMPTQSDCGADQAALWRESGYRPQLVAAAWLRAATTIAQTFPRALVAQDILEGNDFPMIQNDGSPEPSAHPELPGKYSKVKDQILTSGLNSVGSRFVIQWNSLTVGGRLSKVVPRYALLGAHFAWQTNAFRGHDGAGCNNSRADTLAGRAESCSEQGYEAMLRRGVDLGGSYIEIWPADALRFPGVVGKVEALFEHKQRR